MSMKYIITEEQYNYIMQEGNHIAMFKRRLDIFDALIEKEIEEEDPCDFTDEFNYANNIISWAVDEFIKDEDVINSFDGDDDDAYSFLTDYANDKYGERLFDIFHSQDCDDKDDEDDEDEDEWDDEDEDDF